MWPFIRVQAYGHKAVSLYCMAFFYSHLQTAVSLLQQYHCKEPFAAFLKKYFSAHKQFGSRDRRNIAEYCYAAFRLGPPGLALPPDERIYAGLLLTRNQPHPLLQAVRPHFNEAVQLPLHQKMQLANLPALSLQQYFPAADQLSTGIDVPAFVTSHFQQPLLYLRIRPGFAKEVHTKLQQAGIAYQTMHDATLALPNGTDLSNLLEADRQVVVQDYSSQQTGRLLQKAAQLLQQTKSPYLWDCCAASGGKSILASDLLPHVQLLVSDLRPTILHNLRVRFRTAGISKYQLFAADLAQPQVVLPFSAPVDLLWADVPCSGSGTWGRTPEQLVCHPVGAQEQYAGLQRAILRNTVPALRSGGVLLYTTCSVYTTENEAQVCWLTHEMGLQLYEQALLCGYAHRADTLYAALLLKP